MSATALPKHCPDCGAKTAVGDRFCGGCGSRFDGAGAVSPSSAAPEKSTRRGETVLRASAPSGLFRRSALLVPAVVLLVGACVGAGRAYLRRSTGLATATEASKSAEPSRAPATVPARRRYDYTLNVDLADLAKLTTVRLTIEDGGGVREVESRRRSPRERVSVTSRASGERVTWRIYYDDVLVKTVSETSDGRSS